MATNKTLTPTNVTIAIPAMADKPDASVFSNCVDKEADAINALNSKTTIYKKQINKAATTGNYINTGINANDYIVIAAYETSGGAGAPCMVARLGDNIYVYIYQASGAPYTGAITLDVYYVNAQ